MRIASMLIVSFLLSGAANAGFTPSNNPTGSCSFHKMRCYRGEKSRGWTGPSECGSAFSVCMKTGVWSTARVPNLQNVLRR
jgi:hypothetical protein